MPTRLIRKSVAGEMLPVAWPQVACAFSLENVAARQEDKPDSTHVLELERRLADAERAAEARVREAFARGEAEAAARLQNEYRPALERLAEAVREVATFKSGFRSEAEQDLVKLSIAIARRILNRELNVDPEAITGLVRVALDRLSASELHQLRVSPDDAPVVERYLRASAQAVRLQVIPDPGLKRGSAIFESARGRWDASADAQLLEIERGFTDLER